MYPPPDPNRPGQVRPGVAPTGISFAAKGCSWLVLSLLAIVAVAFAFKLVDWLLL